MAGILKTVCNLIRGTSAKKDQSPEDFLAKSENFRLLLAANNRTLELMSEMTAQSLSDQTFGMAYIRGMSVRIEAGVRQMVQRLCLMRPGKYDGLKDACDRIVAKLEEALDGRGDRHACSLVLGIERINAGSISEVGSKMAMLGEIRSELGLHVPQGFSITASAFHLFMESGGLDDEINRLIQICDCDGGSLEKLLELEDRIQKMIEAVEIPLVMEREIFKESERLGNVRLAVRSSAVGEDSEHASFAGQFRSELGVKADDLLGAYRKIVASLYSTTAMAYRLNHGLREDDMVMCVGCLEVVDAMAGGVLYTRPPIGDDDGRLVINAVPGLPCSVVNGSSSVDIWVIDRDSLTICDTEVAEKELRYVQTSSGRVRRERLYGDMRFEPSISDKVAKKLAKTALRIEEHFKRPQDIEWALDRDGRIFILQCRPLSVCGVNTSSVSESTEDRAFAILSSGVSASPGIAAGYVFFVQTDDDMARFPDGGVLLSRNARPQLAALLPRAAAVITEFGSSVGHLANVAREFGVPALIGASEAVERLSGVSVVTVNGDTGTVYLGRRKELLKQVKERRSDFGESEVKSVLNQVLQHITPLSLTDPNSPDFKPESCASLHDITRYCHEKAVAEMFMHGRRPVANARRLVGDLPMRYWLVDIGGGTVNSGDGKYIGLEYIRSNAMKALWKGMTAIPWEGPPPVNAGGLASIISQAASNPALVPGVANDMGERSYFIVGTNYCNLQSRFGFHFCTVEGFAGEDPDRNYALFQFKGGGADPVRRQNRSHLVGEALERHGFIVTIRNDALFARMEGVSGEAVERALAVVGYMLIHTRQIDMVMSDQSAVRHYQEKFDRDIEYILSHLSSEYIDRGQLS